MLPSFCMLQVVRAIDFDDGSLLLLTEVLSLALRAKTGAVVVLPLVLLGDLDVVFLYIS